MPFKENSEPSILGWLDTQFEYEVNERTQTNPRIPVQDLKHNAFL